MKPQPSAQRALAALSHDVGKYLVRTARNIDGPIQAPLPEPLWKMLIADLYEGRNQQRPSLCFAELAKSSDLHSYQEPLAQVAARLQSIDELEPAVRAQDLRAIVCVTELALQVDGMLRKLLNSSFPGKTRGRKQLKP